MIRHTVTTIISSALLVAGLIGPATAQTYNSQAHRFVVETVASGLSHPWGLAFLPDGAMLVTERAGALRRVKDGQISPPIAGVPPVAAVGQGGLLDVVPDPEFAVNRTIYFSFSEPSDDGGTAGTAIGRAQLAAGDQTGLENLRILFRQNKKTSAGQHFGSRIVLAPDGTLFFTIGDRGDRERAQDPFDHAGSVLRINRDGSIPADNPFADGRNGAPEIWSIGHRNPQGAILNKQTGTVWTVEHGARGGDEINHPRAGRNYGWPVISYGRHYSGFKIGEGTHKAGMEQPVYFWDPSIAPSGFAHYDGNAFPNWRGNLFVGALRGAMLVRLEFSGERVTKEERLLEGEVGRIRDVRQGLDGLLYLLTDASDGRLLRLKPAGP